jgi:hypothetical protein
MSDQKPEQDVDVDVTVSGQDDEQDQPLPEVPDEQHEVPDTTVRPDSQPSEEQGEDDATDR